MRKVFALFFLLPPLAVWVDAVSAANVEPAALHNVATPPATTCPQGNSDPRDGCSGANPKATFRQAAAFQPGGFFNTIAGTSANYMAHICGPSRTALCRPPWNVAGVDYPVGYYTPALSTCAKLVYDGTCLLDPALVSIPGCAYNSNGLGGHELDCTSPSFQGVVQHLNFGDVNGHGCTALYILNRGRVSTLLIDDIYMFNGDGNCVVATGNNFNFIFVKENFPGGVTFQNSTIDFNNAQWDQSNGSCVGTKRCNPIIYTLGFSTTTQQYTLITNASGDPIPPTAGSASIHTIRWSAFIGWTTRAPNGHKELHDGIAGRAPLSNDGNTLGEFTFDHNTVANYKQTSDYGPAVFWMCSNYPCAILRGPNVTNNTFVLAYVGGRVKGGPRMSGCIGNSYSGGCVLGSPNNTLFVTSTTSLVGYGADFNCTGGGFVTYKEIPGPYPAGVVDEYMTDGFSGNQYGPSYNQSNGPITCTNVPVAVGSGETGLAALVATHAGAPFGSPNFSNNYMDISSWGGRPSDQNIWDITEGGRTIKIASGAITTTAGVSTLSTNGEVVSVIPGSYVYGVGIGNCATNIQSCPRVETGGTNISSMALDRVVGDVTAIPVQLIPYNWCVTRAVLSGNVDMVGQIPERWINKMSRVTRGNGC